MSDKELRELDAWISERVMGWSVALESGRRKHGPGFLGQRIPGDNSTWSKVPNYSTDSKHAMDALKKCAEKIEFSICKSSETYWIASRDETVEVHNTSLELAICLMVWFYED